MAKTKKRNSEKIDIKSLADDILADIVKNPEDEEIIENISKRRNNLQDNIPAKISLPGGETKNTAFIINYRIDETDYIIGRIFGSRNGDYFIENENTFTSFNKNKERKRYKCVFLKDKNDYSYVIWFDITNLGSVY